MSEVDLRELLSASEGLQLDASNDLQFLACLVGDAAREESFEDDQERARWVIAHCCQELQYLPDLRDIDTGKVVPIGTVPDDHERARNYRVVADD